MSRHQWHKHGAGHRAGSRKCVVCGLRRRIKKGTRLSWEFQAAPGGAWLPTAPFCRAKRPGGDT